MRYLGRHHLKRVASWLLLILWLARAWARNGSCGLPGGCTEKPIGPHGRGRWRGGFHGQAVKDGRKKPAAFARRVVKAETQERGGRRPTVYVLRLQTQRLGQGLEPGLRVDEGGNGSVLAVAGNT